MRIAVNTRLLLKNKLEGIGWFTLETMKRITTNHPEHEFLFIFDRAFSKDFLFSSNITPIVIGPPARHPVLFYLWFNYSIPYVLKKYQADVFISPDGYLSLNTSVPQLAVIHDLSFRHRPEDLPRIQAWYYNYFFPRFARKADRIVTVSEFSKKDISASYGVDPENIDVVCNGVRKRVNHAAAEELAIIRNRYSNGHPYFLYVGALQPRKNLSGLLQAFELFKTRSGSKVKLMIVGAEMHKTTGIYKIFEQLQFRADVIFTGRVTEDELHQIYSAALALTYLPFFEGFGMPIVEAMGAGIPVICSNTTSMPEVGGDAVLYANPHDLEEIADKMTRIAGDDLLRKELSEKGIKRQALFNWDITAERLWDSICRVMDNNS